MSKPVKMAVWIFVITLIMTLHGVLVNGLGCHLSNGWDALLPGLAIFGAAFMLSWGAELAQLEIPPALAIAFLAIVAVMPEYAVDIDLAWTAGKIQTPENIANVMANMTGANRLLIGVGWPVVLFAFWYRTRKREIVLESAHGLEIVCLLFATFYCFIIPIKGTLSLIDSFILFLIFVYYIYRTATSPHREEEAEEGPVELLAKLQRPLRIAVTFVFFIAAAWVIYTSAHPFVEGLKSTGKSWGLSEFLVIQWLAPLASEAPEFIVAIIFALRANVGASLGTLISSKINQWTLLVGALPIAFAVASGGRLSLPLDDRQIEEVYLTAAQSLFAVFTLSNFRFSLIEALTLLALFSSQICFTSPQSRFGYACVYMSISVFIVLSGKERRNAITDLLKRRGKS